MEAIKKTDYINPEFFKDSIISKDISLTEGTFLSNVS